MNIPTVKVTEEMVITESALLTSHPFFASILFNRMEVRATQAPRIKTAATDGKVIWINTDYFMKLTPPERVFLYAHEIAHGMLLHMGRGEEYRAMGFGPDMKPWNHTKWNHATDYIINAMLTECSVGTMPLGGLINPQITGGMLADVVYRDIPDPEEDEGGSGEGGHGGFDEHLDPECPLTEGDKVEMEVAVRQAANAAKSQGDLPGTLREMIDGLLNPRVDWVAFIRMEVSNALNNPEPTFRKLNRRALVSTGLIMPGRQGTASGTIVYTVDTSGSISQHEAKVAITELKVLGEEFTPEHLYILWVDSKVAHVDYIEDMNDLDGIIERCMSEPLPGGGGTDMTKTFDYIDKYGIEPDTCIIFTDGYTPFGEEQDYPVVWAVTTEDKVGDVTHGAKVFVDIHKDD